MTELKIMTRRQIEIFVRKQRDAGKRIVLSSGSWDMLHVGHMRYLKAARDLGDVLIVGVDSDVKIRQRKGKDRPIVSQNERMEMLAHLAHVDVVYLKTPQHESNALIKLICPDVLVVSETTKHSNEQRNEKKTLCGKMVVLSAQAQTSTTARIRLLHVNGQKRFAERLTQEMPAFLERILNEK